MQTIKDRIVFRGTTVMPATDALLFIDTNIYLDLYETAKGKRLLAPLLEQIEHIFVTQQVVDEVKRRKVEVAAGFLTSKLAELKLQINVPDHLFGVSSEENKKILTQVGEINKQIQKVNREAKDFADTIIKRVIRSEDEVSKALASIFTKAVPHSPEEFQRAKERKARGNPPGSTKSIGDELNWEQILVHFRGRKKLWIISRDGDYGTVYKDKRYFNSLLTEELRKISPHAEVFWFDDVVMGIKDFAKRTGTKAEKLPTPEEAEELRREQELERLRMLFGFQSFPPGMSFDDFRLRLQEEGRLLNNPHLPPPMAMEATTHILWDQYKAYMRCFPPTHPSKRRPVR